MTELKKIAAKAAIDHLRQHLYNDMVIGVGTGSTTDYFIDELANIKHEFAGTVASSQRSAKRLQLYDIPVYDLNEVATINFYVDGADEATRHLQLIKGGGGALTREKIVAAVSQKFICIADEGKLVDRLGAFPLPIEVIPMARSYVARELVKLGGSPVYREGFKTDNDNVILDIWHLDIYDPSALESSINQIAGVVTNGLFAQRCADILLLGCKKGVETLYR